MLRTPEQHTEFCKKVMGSPRRLLRNAFSRHSERSEESLFGQNAKKREIPHFADSVRNDGFEVLQQAARRRHFHLPVYAVCLGLLVLAAALYGCSSDEPKPSAGAAQKPVIPQEVQDATKSLLGSEAQVLLYGDLAKTGKQQFLAANVVPNTPKSTVAGMVITRAVVAENEDGKWVELVRCDEYLKNAKGYLALTPLQAVSGWKLQYENSAEQGMSLYFTPVQAGTSGRTLPIAVRWNPATKRYQSMDYSYTNFLNEAPTLQSPRSTVR